MRPDSRVLSDGNNDGNFISLRLQREAGNIKVFGQLDRALCPLRSRGSGSGKKNRLNK